MGDFLRAPDDWRYGWMLKCADEGLGPAEAEALAARWANACEAALMGKEAAFGREALGRLGKAIRGVGAEFEGMSGPHQQRVLAQQARTAEQAAAAGRHFDEVMSQFRAEAQAARDARLAAMGSAPGAPAPASPAAAVAPSAPAAAAPSASAASAAPAGTGRMPWRKMLTATGAGAATAGAGASIYDTLRKPPGEALSPEMNGRIFNLLHSESARAAARPIGSEPAPPPGVSGEGAWGSWNNLAGGHGGAALGMLGGGVLGGTIGARRKRQLLGTALGAGLGAGLGALAQSYGGQAAATKQADLADAALRLAGYAGTALAVPFALTTAAGPILGSWAGKTLGESRYPELTERDAKLQAETMALRAATARALQRNLVRMHQEKSRGASSNRRFL